MQGIAAAQCQWLRLLSRWNLTLQQQMVVLVVVMG
jgi:hypothetical protein